MSKWTVLALVAACAVAPQMARATILDYTLTNVTFNDGGTATGSFTVDSTTGDVTSLNITTTAGSVFGGQSYIAPGGGTFLQPSSFGGLNSFVIGNTANSFYIQLAFDDALSAGGTDELTLTGNQNPYFSFNDDPSYECNNCSTGRWVTGGYATTVVTPVPEPASLALLGIGLAGIGLVRRRRRI